VKTKILFSIYILFFTTSVFGQSILLTGFKPWGGRQTNVSYQAVLRLQKHLQSWGIDTHTCEIPVVFAEAFDVAKNCFDSLPRRPDMVVSFGEGGFKIELNSVADNFASGIDENGMEWTNGRILRGGKGSYQFSLDREKLYCGVSENEREYFSLTKSPGSFLCNYIAYTMSAYLEPKGIPFAFIHLQPFGDDEEKWSQTVDTLARMIFTQLEGPQNLESPFYRECQARYNRAQ
jgi:pyrrolidone-carboxylate peptidase